MFIPDGADLLTSGDKLMHERAT